MFVTAFEALVVLLFGLALVHGIRRYDVKRLLLAFSLIAVVVAVEESVYSPIRYFNAPVQNTIGWFVFTLVGTLILKKLLGTARVPNSPSTSFKWKWAVVLKHPNKFERAEMFWQLKGKGEPMDWKRVKLHFRLFNEVEL